MSESLELVDTHCHLDFEAYDGDRDEVVARARERGVARIVIPGVSPEQWRGLPALRKRYRGVEVAVGVHPQFLPELDAGALESALHALESNAVSLGAIAIGECGLDGPTADRGVPLDDQARVLDRHIEVARDLCLPVILHVYRAHGRALELLERHGPMSAGGILHSYSGSAEIVPRYTALNLHISFAGSITRPSARRPKAAARAVPPERLLIETDGPDQTPTGAPSSRNEPAFLPRILEALAEARDEEPAAVGALTTENARAVLRLQSMEG